MVPSARPACGVRMRGLPTHPPVVRPGGGGGTGGGWEGAAGGGLGGEEAQGVAEKALQVTVRAWRPHSSVLLLVAMYRHF